MRAVESLNICTLIGKSTEELCLKTLNNDVRFEEKLSLV